jgi:hypothetical protein
MPDKPRASVAAATRGVLVAIRLRAVAEVDQIVVTLSNLYLTVEDVPGLLARLELAGLVEHRSGGFPGWRLTPDGRREGERLLGVEVDELAARAQITAAYEQFLALNGPFLRVCTDWQLRDAVATPPVRNDHDDAAYDAAVIERLHGLHEAVLPVCSMLTAPLARFGGYGPRFNGAIGRVDAGALDAIDSPTTDSYHAVWFELHDHLLATLGKDRSSEPLPRGIEPKSGGQQDPPG